MRTAPPVASLMRDVTGDVRAPSISTPASGRPGKGRRRRRSRSRRLLGLVLVLGLIGFGSAKGVSALLAPREVDVPKLSGRTLDEARSLAREEGLEVRVVDSVRHPEVPEGHVVSQDPADGVLLEGKAIGLIMSAGPPLEPVPKVVGLKQDKAEAEIVDAGFVVGDVTSEFSTEQPKDAVISIVPRSGRVELGSEIGLVISKGPRSIEVPDVAGMRAEKAAGILAEAGFDPVLTDSYSDDVPEGKVVSTDPAGGGMWDDGGKITLYISIGPEFKEFRLPDVRGMSVNAATELLESKNLKVKVVDSGFGGSTVAETDPLPGTKVTEGDTIALFTY